MVDPLGDPDPGFRAQLRHDTMPIAVHGVTILILEGFILLVGVGLLVLKKLFPDHMAQLAFLESADIWLAVLFVCMFGSYTLVIVLIRLLRGVRREWNRV